jgi:hypothetical protein
MYSHASSAVKTIIGARSFTKAVNMRCITVCVRRRSGASGASQ